MTGNDFLEAIKDIRNNFNSNWEDLYVCLNHYTMKIDFCIKGIYFYCTTSQKSNIININILGCNKTIFSTWSYNILTKDIIEIPAVYPYFKDDKDKFLQEVDTLIFCHKIFNYLLSFDEIRKRGIEWSIEKPYCIFYKDDKSLCFSLKGVEIT